MPRVTFITPDGTPKDVDALAGISLMMAALTNGVEGIETDCGGSLACGTCHVYMRAQHLSVPPIGGAEQATLEAIQGERRPSSRLSYQIPLTHELCGLVAEIPISQR